MKNILLYLSAFIPMYVLVLLKQAIEMVMGNTKTNALTICVLIFLLLLIVLGLIGLKLELINKKQKAKKIVIVCKENITDEHFLGYFSLFVLFAISFDLTKISMLIVFIAVLVMIGVVYVKNKLFYINPFLNIMGFNFYDITYKEKNGKEGTTKIFFKGDLLLDKEYTVKIKDENFSFMSKK